MGEPLPKHSRDSEVPMAHGWTIRCSCGHITRPVAADESLARVRQRWRRHVDAMLR